MRTLFTLIGLVILVVIAYLAYRNIEGLEVPQFNYDSGAGTRIPSQEWTQPQMIGAVGLGGNVAPDTRYLYTKYKDDYVHNLYDNGNIFHIPTSVTDASDTTEDNLQALVIERSRFAKNIKH